MKKFSLLFCLLFLSLSGQAQEEFGQKVEFFIGTKGELPSFTRLSDGIPVRHFSLPEVDIFNTEVKREVNMLAMMEKERRYKEREVDFSSPLLKKQEKEGIFQISNNVHFDARGSNYDLYTGKKKNPVYEEMQPHLFNDVYRPYYARRNSYYSPYFR